MRPAEISIRCLIALDDIKNTRKIAAVDLRGAAVDRAPFRVAPATR